MYIINDQEKPEISLLEDTELAMQGQLQQKGKVKVERDGVLTAQGCLFYPHVSCVWFPFPGESGVHPTSDLLTLLRSTALEPLARNARE